MKIDRRYFRVTSGLLADRAAQIHKERAAARVEIDAFVIEIGSTGYYCSGFSGALCGFDFASVDRLIWKAAKSGYWPKQNLAAGRAMTRRIKALPPLTPMDHALDCMGLSSKRPLVVGQGKVWFASVTGCGERGIWFVSVPWMFDPETERNEWTPPADWVELKHWEVERDIEELNAARREPAVPA